MRFILAKHVWNCSFCVPCWIMNEIPVVAFFASTANAKMNWELSLNELNFPVLHLQYRKEYYYGLQFTGSNYLCGFENNHIYYPPI